jgi:prolyl-tRNA editing enzyme YbaK/EbsC (Cys-tRNA(Pro) deacylase)
MAVVMGSLSTEPALRRPDLLAEPVLEALRGWPADAPVGVDEVLVAPIDPELADTAAFCEAYGVGMDVSANCVVVSGRRGGELRYAACMVLATTRVDVNTVVRRHLDVRKASFAPMETAVAETRMEYGGITPVGLPKGWPVLVDPRVVGDVRGDGGGGAGPRYVVVGSGVRRSKLVIPAVALVALPGAEVVDGLARPVA